VRICPGKFFGARSPRNFDAHYEGRKRNSLHSSPQNPSEPEDWPQVFEQRLNAGDLDAVMTLYERDAHFVTTSGEILVGHDAIRKALGGLIEAKTQFRSRVVRAVTIGDIAQLYTDFEGTRVDGSGKTVAVHNNAIEVLRRQPAGDWKLIMGDPNGRK
jgi:uncharacterized protein (TIGR02246 family)